MKASRSSLDRQLSTVPLLTLAQTEAPMALQHWSRSVSDVLEEICRAPAKNRLTSEGKLAGGPSDSCELSHESRSLRHCRRRNRRRSESIERHCAISGHCWMHASRLRVAIHRVYLNGTTNPRWSRTARTTDRIWQSTRGSTTWKDYLR